ncbi:MAG TPA: hypothetical protein VG758_28630 [Hyphomicrobiaceae bacterium]|jgi:hypothetical protein|nr:hypothetical protein [Hyphomicrobiaceae bacterium]
MSMSIRRHYLGLALLLAIATGAVLAAAAIVRAQDATHMDHAQHMHGGNEVVPTHPGQEAFGTIQEIVRILEADPSTDWSKVNIGALREHLIDMDEVTLRAQASERALANGIEITVTGQGRTLGAIKRMVPANTRELIALGWKASTDELPNGIKLVVTSSDPRDVVKVKALGFIGIMVQGAHHQPHHLMMAKGEFAH